MADKNEQRDIGEIKYRDNGDGTLSEYFAIINTPVAVEQNDLSNSFSISTNATSGGEIDSLSGMSAATIQRTGAATGTIQVQVTVDGVNWVNVTGSNQLINAVTGAYIASGNITAAGIYQVDISGCAGVRVISTTLPSAAITGIIKVTNATAMISLDGQPTISAAISGTWTVTAKPSLVTPTNGQNTSNSTAVQLNGGTSVAATNYIILKALSGNSANVYVGKTGVTTSNGLELKPGDQVTIPATNINLLYVIGSNSSDKISWLVC